MVMSGINHSLKKGIAPRPGIDTDVRWWGYIHTTGWVFWIQITSSIFYTATTTTADDLILPLTADVTTANVPDNKMYVPLTSSSVFSLSSALYMVSDPGYDDNRLYNMRHGHNSDIIHLYP